MRRIIYLILFYGTCLCVWSQNLRVEYPQEINLTDAFVSVKFVFDGGKADSFDAPQLRGFKLLSKARRTYNLTDDVTIYTVLLKPLKSGDCEIGKATVHYKGKRISSKVCRVEVSAQNENVSLDKIGTPISERDLFIRVVSNRSAAYVNEPFRVSYYLYYKGDGLQNVTLKDKPDFQGMVAESLPFEQLSMHTKMVKGVRYKVGKIIEYEVIAQKKGKYYLSPATFECVLAQKKNFESALDDFFNSGAVKGIKVLRSSNALKLDVKSLPTDAPKYFSGGVGEFEIRGKLVEAPRRIGEMGVLKIKISGSGAMSFLKAPQVDFPKDFEVYPPKTVVDSSKRSVVFEYTFVPQSKGRFIVPKVEFCYFDLATKAYKTISTSNYELRVSKEMLAHDGAVSYDSSVKKLRSQAVSDEELPYQFYGSWFWYSSWLLIVGGWGLLLAGFRYWMTRNANGEYRMKSKAGEVALKALMKIEAGDEGAYRRLNDILVQYIAHKFNLELRTINPSTLGEVMKESSLSREMVNRLEELLKTCNNGIYAPISSSSLPELRELAIKTIKEVESYG